MDVSGVVQPSHGRYRYSSMGISGLEADKDFSALLKHKLR